MFVTLREPVSGTTKEVKIGFSWTTLFFWSWVPFLRGDLLWWGIIFVARSLSARLEDFGSWVIYLNRGHSSWFTLSLPAILILLIPIFYNRLYLHGLLRRGYEPMMEDYFVLKERGILDSPLNALFVRWIEKGVFQSLLTVLLWVDWGEWLPILIANGALFILYGVRTFLSRKGW